MDPLKEPDVHPHMDTKHPSKEEGASVGQFRGPHAVVDRDHQPIDVSSPFIDNWTDVDVPSDDSISWSDISELDLNDALEAQPTASTAQDASDLHVSSSQIGATVTPSTSEVDLTDVSSDDSISCSDISELDLNDAFEAQTPAPIAQDASDWDISSDQTQAKATPSVSDLSDLESEWKLLSAEIWETVHPSWSDIPDPNDASEAQPTAPTAHLASDFEYLAEQILATATLLVICHRRLATATATTSASNVPSRSRWEAANPSAYNKSSSQRWATATTSASSDIPSHSRWEAANPSAYNRPSSQRWATATTSASNILSSQSWATATTSASNRSSRQHQRGATATTSAPTQLAAPTPTHPIPPVARSSTPTQRTWPAPVGSKSCSTESWTAPTGSKKRSSEHWPAPNPLKRKWGAAYVPSTAVNDDAILPFNPIWYTPSSIRHFKPLPVPPPTYENGGLPSTEPSSSENLVPDVADDTFDLVQAVDPAVGSGRVSPKIEPRRTIYKFVAAIRACLRPFLNF